MLTILNYTSKWFVWIILFEIKYLFAFFKAIFLSSHYVFRPLSLCFFITFTDFMTGLLDCNYVAIYLLSEFCRYLIISIPLPSYGRGCSFSKSSILWDFELLKNRSCSSLAIVMSNGNWNRYTHHYNQIITKIYIQRLVNPVNILIGSR